jgi:excisionase family DNA binding protein
MSESEVVPLQEAAARLGIHRSTAYDLVKKGKFPLPIVRVNKSIKVPKAKLDYYIEHGQLPPANGSSKRRRTKP